MSEHRPVQVGWCVFFMSCALMSSDLAQAQPHVDITIHPKRPDENSVVEFNFSRVDTTTNQLLYVALTMHGQTPGIELDQSRLDASDTPFLVGQLQALPTEVRMLAGVEIAKSQTAATVSLKVSGIVTEQRRPKDRNRTYRIALTPSSGDVALLPSGVLPVPINTVTVNLPENWQPDESLKSPWSRKLDRIVGTFGGGAEDDTKSVELTLIEVPNALQLWLQEDLVPFMTVLVAAVFVVLIVVGVVLQRRIASRRKIGACLLAAASVLMLIAAVAVGFTWQDLSRIPFEARDLLAATVGLSIVAVLPEQAQKVMTAIYESLRK